MAKGTNQKLKLLYLLRILFEKTDDEHSITMPEIITSLKAYDVPAERKSVYADIEALREYGIDIEGVQEGRSFYYHICSREFELPELKLLVDLVQAAKFISEKKSNELIRKLETQTSHYEAKKLQRQVFVSGRIKADNESIYYNVDMIHVAINENHMISFQYFQWNVEKKMELRHDGKRYVISPWALLWADENYYMVGYDSEATMIKHFRVDKMLKIKEKDSMREGQKQFECFDIAQYSKKMFGMFDGEEQYVKLEIEKNMAGVIVDRFGKDVSFIKQSDGKYTVNIKAAVSRQFLSWVISLGDGVRIIGPDKTIEKVREEIKRLQNQYL